MAEIRNGILYIDNEPVIALGTHYYASYHPQKVPVPESGDRLTAMREDLAGMKKAGFRIIRTAALGEVLRDENGTVCTSFPFIDEMLEECRKQGLSAFVRLQGYDVNLSGITDGGMLDQDDRDMPPFWGWFVRNCLNHPGILRDNEDATVATAAHFRGNDTVLGYQIYNEPGYPTEGFYDYNPHSIAAWRKWLAETGKCDEATARTAEPPRKRPAPGEDIFLWENWRLFHFIRMNEYLNHLAHKAKEGWDAPSTFTCHTTSPVQQGSTQRGEDFFRVAKEMDFLGMTHYLPSKGAQYFEATKVLDAAESAAAVFGKHAWLIEYNAHTSLSGEAWERETYAALGSGMKGIMYYQWRADYPYDDAPEPEGYGMLYNDGTTTGKFASAVAMNHMVETYGGQLARMDKYHCGVALLYSENVNAHCDALDNGAATLVWAGRERSYLNASAIYGTLRRQQIPVDLTRASELEDNRIHCRLLILPTSEGLSEEERKQLDAFAAEHTVVIYNEHLCGYYRWGENSGEMLTLEELLKNFAIEPPVETNAPLLDVKILKGQDSYALFLVNYSVSEIPVAAGAGLCFHLPEVTTDWSCRFITPDRELVLSIEFMKTEAMEEKIGIRLPEITTGGMILLQKNN